MDIPQFKEEDQSGEHSLKDALFYIKSQIILPKKKAVNPHKYKFGFKKSFEPIIANFILKKTLNTSWKERYFLLTSTRLLYYSDSTMKVLKGCFNLASLVQYKLKIKFNSPEIYFVVQEASSLEGQKTLLQLRVQDQNIYEKWHQQLAKVLVRLKGMSAEDLRLFPRIKEQNLRQSNTKLGISDGNFWNNLIISQHQLMKYASHLDIILLRSKNPIFYLHRFFMRSHYDHVGVLIKDESERLFLFEAIQSKGVCISSFDSLLATFQDEYQQMGYRKLLVENNANLQIQRLQDYINSILGSKYELSLSKLLIDNETIKNDEPALGQADDPQPPQSQKQEKTYFCSELIADLYLKFGILSQGKSNNFWPKDFEEDEMVLGSGFKFSPIMILQLDEPPQTSQMSEN